MRKSFSLIRLLLFVLFVSNFPQLEAQVNVPCTPSSSSCGGITITSLKFGTINNSSACGLYTDYTGSVGAATVNAGTFVPITVSFTAWVNVYGTGYVKAWIDFNQNGIFEDSESFNIASAESNSTQTFLIRIPFDAIGGLTRMRVRIGNSGFSQIAPCTQFRTGETEDYAINIVPSITPKSNLTVYVNQKATGTNNGASWANALISLSEAFAIVKGNDTIKVAKGNYTPGYLLTNGVTYLGGYPNTGNPTDADRNFALNTTVLSGQEIFGYNLESNTTLNGFIFDNLESVGGFKSAIRLENADPLIKNCVFRNNNKSTLYIYASSPVILNCFFIDNHGNIQLFKKSNPKFINCVFNKNTGAGLFRVSNSDISIKNCTFSNNQIHPFNDGIVATQAEIIISENSSATVANCIFSDDWEKRYNLYTSKATDSLNLFADNSSKFSVVNSLVGYNQQGNNLLRMLTPKFKDSTNAAGADGLYFTADDGLQIINPCSAAMNTGLNSAVESNTDILGNKRIVSIAVDMGAYEIQNNPTAVPGVVYVNASAKGLNDGSNWTNAFTDLQIALSYCSDTLKVAEGTYYPAESNPNAFFEMQNNRVILGGYPNAGNPADNLRNPTLHPTILNGNLKGNAKSRNLVQAILVDSTAVLDGFVIDGAVSGAIYISYNAHPIIKNCTIKNNITGSYILKESKPFFEKCIFINNSGGVKIDDSSPIIDSCRFEKNTEGALANTSNSFSIIKNSVFLRNSNTAGGDIFNDNSNPQIMNCVFDSSFAESLGGSIANVKHSRPLIIKCVFKNSKSTGYYSSFGGVCYNKDSEPYFLNCSFINSQGKGGSFYNLASTVTLESCVAYGNKDVSSTNNVTGSFMTNSRSNVNIINSNILKSQESLTVINNTDNSVLTIKNSIFWDNNFNSRSDSYYQIVRNTYQNEIINTSSVTNISNSITRKYGIDGVNGNRVGVEPRFININNPAGEDGLYGTADDGLALCSCSPAINAGEIIPGMANTDIAGNPRVFNSGLDIGAYEFQSSAIDTSKIMYVSSGASGTNSGADWQNAYNNLHDALQNTCADTIKIMEGIYRPAFNSRDSSFEINRKLFLMGGYKNSSAPLEADRDPDNYPTILSGEIGNLNDSTDNSFIILKINYTDTLIKIDGLTFSDCYSDNKIGQVVQYGGAIYSLHNANLAINNCRFYNNHSIYNPNSLKSFSSNINLTKNVFSKNYSDYGSTVEMDDGVISNNVFSDNYSLNGNNVVATGKTDFKNCVFYKNFAGGGGAGVLNKGVSTLINSNFIENNAKTNGAGIINANGSRAYLLNCIFNGNYTGNGIYADWYDYKGGSTIGSSYYPNLKYFSIVNSVVQTSFPSQSSVTYPGNEHFVNVANPIGPDNRWFTNDDGFKLLPCSPLIDAGHLVAGIVLESRNIIMPETDIMDSTRIKGAKIDVGAYEYPGYFNATVNISVTDSVICANSTVKFKAITTGMGTDVIYQWQLNGVNAGTNSDTFTISALNDNDQVKVLVSLKESCASGLLSKSNIITIRVKSALTSSVNIVSDKSSICHGMPVTFTATPLNGGTNPVYQWQVNGINSGTNQNTFTTSSLDNNALVRVILTSSVSCVLPDTSSSNTIAIKVTALPVANAGKDVSVCAGGSVMLNASGGNSYSWSPAFSLSNAAIANPISNPLTTTTYILTVTNGNNCSSKDSVIVTVNQLVSPVININSSSDPICFGNVTTFTADVKNEGTNPIYQWQVNGINTGNNGKLFTTATLNDGDQVRAILTSNASCITKGNDTSRVIKMIVKKLDEPIVSLHSKVLTVENPDAAAAYTWQLYWGNAWNNVVPAATGISFNVPANGEYRVMADKNPCLVYSKSNVAILRTSPTNNSYGINLYPNPGNKIITLDSIQLSQNWETLDIVTADGQQVFPSEHIKNKTTVSLDISGLRKGTYFVQLRRLDGKVTSIRFVKL